jgi:hypothetical protein
MPTKIILDVIKGGLSGKSFVYTEKKSLILGRQDDCAIVFPTDDATVSRHHCMIDIAPPSVVVRDLNSLNGTFLNGDIIGQRETGESTEGARGMLANEFSMQTGDRLGLGKDCELILTVKQPEVESIKKATTRKSNQLCEVCGAALTDDSSLGICEECQNDPDKLYIRWFQQVKRAQNETDEIAGYKKVRSLGKGGMGQVWLVEEQATAQRMALKLMLPSAASDEKNRKIFTREAMITGQLVHKNIIKQHKFGQSGDMYFILMELCDGGSVEDLMKKHGGNLTIALATDIILQVLEGLIYAHSASILTTLKNGDIVSATGVVHRDLKPSNILLCSSDNSLVAKVADFGLAKAFETAGRSGNSHTNQKGGTPEFMPRQLVRNYKYSKPDVDVWAAAASYYYMLTGIYPKDFERGKDAFHTAVNCAAVPIRKRDLSIPKKLAEVIDCALIEEPVIGVRSALELKEMIEGAL